MVLLHGLKLKPALFHSLLSDYLMLDSLHVRLSLAYFTSVMTSQYLQQVLKISELKVSEKHDNNDNVFICFMATVVICFVYSPSSYLCDFVQ